MEVSFSDNSSWKEKRPGDYYLQNLAIADLGTLVMTTPFDIIRLEMPLNWPFGEFACLYFYPVVEIFYGSSVVVHSGYRN